jgi:hypothetical protein
MPANLDPQLQLDEKAITHPDLEKALERHLRARGDADRSVLPDDDGPTPIRPN